MREIAIVGGGPSGALCGERLAAAGFRVAIYDERGAWEKPCGGGLTWKACERYPFLLHGPEPKKIVRKVELVASNGLRAKFELDRPIVIYSRAVLNGLLLERARRAGARVEQARVTALDTAGARVRLQTTGAPDSPAAQAEADFVVVAAGARNALLPGTTPLSRHDLEQTVGYYVPTTDKILKVKFLPKFEGYLWSFPRADHLSVGICGQMARHTTRELREHLNRFMDEERIPRAGARFYSHVLPSPERETLAGRRVAGRNWALVGDAAAWVDPITGEGLYYALRSGDILAGALADGRPEEYPARVRADFSADLEFATRVARRLYRKRFLGGAVTLRMIQFADRSATFRQLLRDVFAGAQDYRSLKRRLWAQVGVTLSEIAASLLHPHPREELVAEPRE
jgi:flavin-dependent dehydrogenase